VKRKTALTLVDPKDETEKIKKRFDELFSKTNNSKAKEADVDALRKIMRDNPERELWKRIGGVMAVAETFLLQTGPLSPGIHEILRERQQVLRKELGYDEASEMEQLLISHAALCWLRLGLTEIRYTSIMNQSITLTLGMYWEKRLTVAQRRFERACETLERVRLLARSRPALRLVGQKTA
jgi:hypothetical protein